MVWQKGIAHIFTWTNIIIPKHKHVNISVFSLGRNTAPDLSYEKMTRFVCVKFTCQGCYWSLHQRSPQVLLSSFIRSQGGREERERKNREWKDDPGKREDAVGSSAPGTGAPIPKPHHRGCRGLIEPTIQQPNPETKAEKTESAPLRCSWGLLPENTSSSLCFFFPPNASRTTCPPLKIYSNNVSMSSIS